MTDEQYVFQQIVKERAKMKTGARHRKRGNRSKKCTLPSDFLTPKQKKSMNGECEIINLNKPLNSMDDLRKYSISLQKEYLKNCIENYGARRVDLVSMLHTSHCNLKRYLEKNDIILNFPYTGVGFHSKMDDRWAAFIGLKASDEPKPEIERVVMLPDYNPYDNEYLSVVLDGAKVAEKSESHVTTAIEDVTPTTSVRDYIYEQIQEIKQEEEKPPVKKISGYNAVIKMKLDLKGTKAEIMQMMDAILGDECNYIVKLDIVNADNDANITAS